MKLPLSFHPSVMKSSDKNILPSPQHCYMIITWTKFIFTPSARTKQIMLLVFQTNIGDKKNSGNRCLFTVYRNFLRFLFMLLLQSSRPMLVFGGRCHFLWRYFLTALCRFYNHRAFPALRQSSSGNSGRFCPDRWCPFAQ